MTDTDALFALLSSLKLLILHGESLNYTINQYTDYITYTLRKSFIPRSVASLPHRCCHCLTSVSVCVCVCVCVYMCVCVCGSYSHGHTGGALSLDLSSVCVSLWKLLQTEHSHLATLVVPLLLHCMTLTTGAGVLWHLVENDFSHDDWKVRFGAGMSTFNLFLPRMKNHPCQYVCTAVKLSDTRLS